MVTVALSPLGMRGKDPEAYGKAVHKKSSNCGTVPYIGPGRGRLQGKGGEGVLSTLAGLKSCGEFTSALERA